MSSDGASKVRVGCCGFGGSLASYVELFNVVEIQHTFYQPPQNKTLKKWRAETPDDFEFTLKAWQLITHESKSPTYRRLKRELTEKEREQCGGFRNSKIVRETWLTTLECADALNAKRILFQCPASFKPTEQNIENMREFFGCCERDKRILYFEPRGKAWTAELVRELCAELKLSHAVDPFASETQTPKQVYFRLHGKTDWRYKYTDEDIDELSSTLPSTRNCYVFFNNITMRQDALRFASRYQ
jgi:uncharacterized protein YecE (DUF72 family)